MKEITVLEKYPVHTLEIAKNETTYKNIDEIFTYLKEKIEAHPIATYIGEFDHYTHTSSLEVGEINDSIKDAKNIIWQQKADFEEKIGISIRPRSIGVAEMAESFVVSFMVAPNPDANTAMQNWVKGIKNI